MTQRITSFRLTIGKTGSGLDVPEHAKQSNREDPSGCSLNCDDYLDCLGMRPFQFLFDEAWFLGGVWWYLSVPRTGLTMLA